MTHQSAVLQQSKFTTNKFFRFVKCALHKTLCFLSSKLPHVLKDLNRKRLILQHLLHLEIASLLLDAAVHAGKQGRQLVLEV